MEKISRLFILAHEFDPVEEFYSIRNQFTELIGITFFK